MKDKFRHDSKLPPTSNRDRFQKKDYHNEKRNYDVYGNDSLSGDEDYKHYQDAQDQDRYSHERDRYGNRDRDSREREKSIGSDFDNYDK